VEFKENLEDESVREKLKRLKEKGRGKGSKRGNIRFGRETTEGEKRLLNSSSPLGRNLGGEQRRGGGNRVETQLRSVLKERHGEKHSGGLKVQN